MRIVVALGGNALLKRGEPMTAEVQRGNVALAAQALAPLARQHQLLIAHGNGPQVGLLALQAAAYPAVEAYPLDVLGAQTEDMIGYLIEQELSNRLPGDVPIATLLTRVEVDPRDRAFQNPTKFVGPVYDEREAKQLAAAKGWVIKGDGDKWRRGVPSPMPRRIVEIRPIPWLLDQGTIVICVGGGGIPTMCRPDGSHTFVGVEAVIDKDLASALLAREVEAALLVLATDVDGVYLDWHTPQARLLRHTTPQALQAYAFPEGSMGPKVAAACWFVRQTGRRAAIGALADLPKLVAGLAGTQVGTLASAAEKPSSSLVCFCPATLAWRRFPQQVWRSHAARATLQQGCKRLVLRQQSQSLGDRFRRHRAFRGVHPLAEPRVGAEGVEPLVHQGQHIR
jgi:carbamate kinase